jgi:hypothetical protein
MVHNYMETLNSTFDSIGRYLYQDTWIFLSEENGKYYGLEAKMILENCIKENSQPINKEQWEEHRKMRVRFDSGEYIEADREQMVNYPSLKGGACESKLEVDQTKF